MATATGKALCVTCGQDKVAYPCQGCAQNFCLQVPQKMINHFFKIFLLSFLFYILFDVSPLRCRLKNFFPYIRIVLDW